MRSVDEAAVTEGSGLEGDRYQNSRHRHVSVQSIEDLEVAAEVFGAPIAPALTRRNITVSGVIVPTAPGSPVRIGEVPFEVVRIAAPCRLLDDDIGDGARVALRRRAGSILRSLGSGHIAVGDPIVTDDPG